MKRLLGIAVGMALLVPGTAHAGAASTASAAAKHRYTHVTNRPALAWRTTCWSRGAGSFDTSLSVHRRRTWRCRSQVWNGAVRGFFRIRVRGGVARIIEEGYVA